jgi:long-chain acyl-CoA synthetase
LSKAEGLKKRIINWGTVYKQRKLEKGNGTKSRLFDRLVFNKIKGILGGNVRFVLSGSAPIAGDVLSFLKICFQCEILEGYGLTETSAGTLVTAMGDPKAGYIGGPLHNVKVKLKDLPEMGHLHTNEVPSGELCVWSPSVMSGYFKNEEETKKNFDHGWLLTGDVAKIDENGAVTIIDRVKNIFKLSQGEYIAPEKLENIYIQSDFIQNIWIYGESTKDFAIAFIVVNPERVKTFAEAHAMGDKTVQELLSNKLLISAIQ